MVYRNEAFRSGRGVTMNIAAPTTQPVVADWPALLTGAHEALRTAVLGVAADGWNLPTPCANWSVAQVLQHAAGDQIAFAAAITGGPWPSEDPFSPSGQLAQAAPTIVDEAVAASAQAFSTVDRDAAEVPNPLPQGPMPAWLAAGACALDAAVHAWDIAVATGQPSALTPAVARQLMSVATRIVEPLRAYGAYGPAIATEDDDVAELLGYLGRDVTWRP
jgi:uncharacterized protein (TIGR03086 family)